MKMKGKFMVIDGTDGSGKATQVKLLAERLRKEGKKVKVVDFPAYYDNFFGEFIGHCLSEQYYNWLGTHPKIASVVYAADRWESKDEMDKWLSRGYVLIANRYTSSLMIHMGGKIKDPRKRVAFGEWVKKMEYEIFKIPRPSITFYLSLPISISLDLIGKRDGQMKRKYLKKKKDVHENDVEFLLNSRKSALFFAKREKNWVKIDCAQKGEILTREAIHEMVYKEVKKVFK